MERTSLDRFWFLVATIAVALSAWPGTASAQPGIEDGPAPAFSGLSPLSEVPVLETPPMDVAVAVAMASAESLAGGPVRFAEPFTVEAGPSSHGRWEVSSDGRTVVWRLRVVSAGAVSLNLGFDRYRMPPGGRLRIRTPDGREIVGPFTDADNEEHGELWTPVLSGGDAVIEVAVPVDGIRELDLRLDSVNRGFRDLTVVRSPSHGSCHVDVACRDGDSWRDQIRSVGHYSVSGRFACSGALLNNVAADGRMFFLTSGHCFHDAEAEAASVVVYWNYELPACGVGTATRRDSQSGAAFRAQAGPLDSDLLLLELDDEPNPSHKLYLAGWNAFYAPAISSAVGIHHPRAHTKSISVAKSGLMRTPLWQGRHHPDGGYWRVPGWERGANEKGSSGSPLFDQDGRIIGALQGGTSECGDDGPDWYGAVVSYWPAEAGSPDKRLSEWLDPGGTGARSLDGMNPNHRPSVLRALDGKALAAPADGESAEALTFDLEPFFRDWDGDALTYAATSSDTTAVTVSVSGSSVSVTPVASGSATITVTATDVGGSNKEATQMFQVTIGANRSPETSGALPDRWLNEGATANVDLTGAFTDGDGDTLTYAASSTDTSVAMVALSGSTVTVTAVKGSGTATIDVTATDAGGSNTKARHRFDVTVLNDPPQAVGSLSDVTLQVGDGNQVVEVATAFTDPEGDTLSYGSMSSAVQVARVTTSGSSVTLMPVARGNATFTVTATDLDGSRESATQTIEVRVKGRRGVSVSTAALTVVEGSTATYTVALQSEPTGEVTITPSVASGSDVTVSPSSLTFDASDWETAQTVTVGAAHDTDMAAESVAIRHAVSGADYGSVTAASLTANVADDEGPPVLSVGPASGSESAGSLTFDVTLLFATTEEVTVDYATSDGTASAGADYTAASGTLTFPAGTTAGQIVVDIVDDDRNEVDDNETFRLTLRNAKNGTLGGSGSTLEVLGTIRDDDVFLHLLANGPTRAVLTEGGGWENVGFRVSPSPPEGHLTHVAFEWTHDGGANRTDYEGFLTSSRFYGPTNELDLRAIDDDLDEDCERMEIRVLPVTPGLVDSVTMEFLIKDNDGEDNDCDEDSLGDGQPTGGGGQPPGGGGQPPPPEPDPEPEPPPSSRPPAAAFTVEGATCDADLCRALTGEALRFEDTSAGTVRFRRWEFGDGNMSRAAAPVRAWSSPGFYEVTLDVSDGTSPSTARRTFLVEAAEPKGTCVADAETSCLQDSRYAVTVEWRDGDGGSGAGRVVHAGTNDSGMFRFFGRENWEVLIKVLDGCAANGHVWVYGASTTDLGYVIRVTDTATGTSREYRNEPGTPATAVTDARAFPGGCRR